MNDQSFENAKLLIVDDEERNVRLLHSILKRGGYSQIESTTDSRDVMRLYQEWHPDIILLDLHMPHLDGFEIMQILSPLVSKESYLPILVLTADITPVARNKALSMGAKDFLAKPLDGVEVLLRARNLLENRFVNQTLEARVQERALAFEHAQSEVLQRLAEAAELRDDDTGQHTRRVGEVCALLARELGLPDAKVEELRLAAPLHDVGKIGIPDSILLKAGRLTEEEFALIKQHTKIGANLLRDGHSALIHTAQIIAHSHHERWDGRGYPDRLAGEDIPLEGRIVAVADVFDALTHIRPYKAAWPVEQALAEIVSQSGLQFDPRIIEAFKRLPHKSLV